MVAREQWMGGNVLICRRWGRWGGEDWLLTRELRRSSGGGRRRRRERELRRKRRMENRKRGETGEREEMFDV